MKKKTVEELVTVCDQLRTIARFVRMTQWPVKGLGVGLTPEAIDPVLKLADEVIPAANQQLREDNGFLD